MPEGDWTDSRIRLLRQLIEAGASAGQARDQINAAMGTSFSRNAVIGKMRRLGIVSQNKWGKQPADTVKLKQPKESKRTITVRHAVPSQSPKLPAMKAAPPPQEVIKPFKLRELYGVAAERCTYTDDCDEPPVRGRFYCEAHCMIVYRPPTQPRQPQRPHHRPTRR